MKARFLALAALVLGLASCQTEPEGLNVNAGGEVDTTITVSIPETETRAGGNNSAEGAFKNVDLTGDATIRYILQIFDQNNRPSDAEYVKYSDGNTVTFDVRLVPNRDYRFVVWADYVESETAGDKHYNTRNSEGKIDLTNITLNDTWVAMDETRDAFTGYFDTADGDKRYSAGLPINITLKRPFAKLRVITTDMKALNDLQIEPTYATVTYSTKHYSTFNAVDGSCSGEIANKTHNYFIAPYADHNGNTSKVLFTDYFFANKQDEVVNFTLVVYDEQGYDEVTNTYTKNDDYIIKTNNFNTPIPAQRNYLTTISGNVLTDGNNVKVDVQDVFENWQNPNDKPYYNEIVEVGNATDLQEAINESTEETTIVFSGNIDLGNLSAGILSTRAATTVSIVIPEGKVVALDLNGFNLTTPFVEGSDTNHTYAFENRGSLTIQDSEGNGQIIARGIFNYGTMTLKSGTINACDGNGGYGVRNYNSATFVMNGGSIVTSLEDGDARVAGNYDASPLRVDEGATATINGGNITNISNYTVAIDNYGTTTINGGNITSVHSTVSNSGTMTIKGDATTIKCEGEYTSAHPIYAHGEASVTTIENGNIIGNDKASCYYVAVENNPKVYISGGEFTNAGQAAFTGEGTIVVTGGQFDKDPSERVAEGYEVVEENGCWIVRKPEALVAFETAIAQGGNVTLTTDITLAETVVIESGKTVVLNLNGKTISGNWHKNNGAIIKNNGTLTISNGTISSIGANGGSAIANYGTLTIDNATINGAPREGESWPSYPINNYSNATVTNSVVTGYQGCLALNNAGTTTINDCNFTKNYEKTSSHVFYVNHADAKVIINGGTYNHNGFDGSLAYINKGEVTINAGTFNAKDGGYGVAVLSGGKVTVNGGTLPAFLNWGGQIIDNRTK